MIDQAYIKQMIGMLEDTFLGDKPKVKFGKDAKLYRAYIRTDDGQCLAFGAQVLPEYEPIDWQKLMQGDRDNGC